MKFGTAFVLQRNVDESGISGVGVVAWGVRFPDETCVLRWVGERGSTVMYANIGDLLAIHGHGGKTELLWQGDESACGCDRVDVEFVAGIPVIRVPVVVSSADYRPDC